MGSPIHMDTHRNPTIDKVRRILFFVVRFCLTACRNRVWYIETSDPCNSHHECHFLHSLFKCYRLPSGRIYNWTKQCRKSPASILPEQFFFRPTTTATTRQLTVVIIASTTTRGRNFLILFLSKSTVFDLNNINTTSISRSKFLANNEL